MMKNIDEFRVEHGLTMSGVIKSFVVVIAGTGLQTGCAGGPVLLPLAADHPANPAAAAAPAPAPSTTLAIGPAVPSSTPGAMPSMQQGGGQMKPAVPGAQPAAPAMPAGQHEGHAASASPATDARRPATQPAAGQPLYVCPMHPDVFSTSREDRCPKCKMKITKPVKRATAPATAPASPPGGHAGHGREQGGPQR